MHPRHTLAAGALALLAAFPAAAQTEPQGEAVIVTATRQPVRANELLSDVTVIDREEIERNGQGSITELLARQPGIQTASSGGPGTSTSYYIRGARPEQTKVLVDGIPINSVDASGSPLRFMPLSDVERIEIVRGPASTLYGADAIGGVIQIFTRRGAPGLRADGFAGFGTQKTGQANAGVSGGNEQWRFRLEGHHYTTEGISARKDASNRDADKDPHRNTGGAASLSFTPVKGHEVGTSFRQNEGVSYYDNGFGPANGTYNNRVDFKSEQWQVFSRNKFHDAWTSKLQYGESIDDQRNFYAGAPSKGDQLKTLNRQTSWQNDIKLPLGTALLGIERLDQKATPDKSFKEKAQITTDSLFAGWSANHGNHRWQINARSDDNSKFGKENTHSLAYGYQITDSLRAHASYGTAFKAPSVYQLYDQYSGNASLQAETGKNSEAALTWERANHTVSATYYLNRVDNLIDYDFSTWKYKNVAKARLEGVTLAYAGRFSDWSFRTSYDWLNATHEANGRWLELGRRAKNRGSVAVDKHWSDRLSTGAEVIAVGSRYNDNSETEKTRMGGYSLVNLTGRYALSKDLALEGRINNLFDKAYETVDGYGTLGINAFVGIRYQPK